MDVARTRRWVVAKNGQIGQHSVEVRIEIDVDPGAITILECRAPWSEDLGPEWTRQQIARLRYTKSTGTWKLYWSDRNSKFHRYPEFDPTLTVEPMLAEVDDDPRSIFWG